MDTLNDLKQFYEKIIEYKKLLQQWYRSLSLSDELGGNIQSVRTELQRGYARLENTIKRYGGAGFDQHTFYLAFDSLTSDGIEGRLRTLNKVIPIVNKAIGKLEVEGKSREVELPKKPKDAVKLPLQLFDSLKFHPKVVEASRKLFKDGHYRDAIYRAFVEVNNFVKDKANSQLDGKKLMSTVFSLEKPIIKLNSLQTQSDRDEQEGFMFLFMGAMEGIRNPKAHENIIQNDPYRTLEYLGLASLLMKIAEEGKLVVTNSKEQT